MYPSDVHESMPSRSPMCAPTALVALTFALALLLGPVDHATAGPESQAAFDDLYDSAGERLTQAGSSIDTVRREIMEELKSFAETYQGTPEEPLALLNAGSLAYSLEDFESAAALYREALDSNPPRGLRSQIAYKLSDVYATPGRPIQAFSAKTLDGETVSSESLKGTVYLLDFWATWCGPCIAELPHLQQTYAKYRDQGFRIVSISSDDNEEALMQFFRQNDMPWTQVWDKSPEQSGELGKQFAVWGIPHTILVDENGIIVASGLRGKALSETVGKTLGD